MGDQRHGQKNMGMPMMLLVLVPPIVVHLLSMCRNIIAISSGLFYLKVGNKSD